MLEKQFKFCPHELPKRPENKYLIVDVRSSKEYKINHISGAINIPFSDDQKELEAFLPIDKTTDILLYSEHANRSIYALIFYYLSGYENVCYIDGGLNNWKSANRKPKSLHKSLQNTIKMNTSIISSTTTNEAEMSDIQ